MMKVGREIIKKQINRKENDNVYKRNRYIKISN